jgi:hypothetical protein
MLRTITLVSLVLALALVTTTNAQIDDAACTLDCPLDAPCTLGHADFSEITIALGHATHLNNMHCACPPGWTGVVCDHKFEACSDNHECYHGGECLAGLTDKFGNEQLFCDCTHAVSSDGTKYVGKYCETPFDTLCDHDDSGDLFCVNGGDCNPNYE